MKKRKKTIITAIIIILVLAAVTAAAALYMSGAVNPGWHEIRTGFHYYIDQNGKPASGYVQVDGEPYYFGRFGIPSEKGWITEPGSDEAEFYCEGNGRLMTGWHYMEGKARYFYQEQDCTDDRRIGEVARDFTTAGGIYIDSRGYLDGEEGEAVGYGIDVLNRYGWDLESAYKYSAALRYADGRSDDYGLTIHSCGWHGFKYGEGNCLAWAGTFCVMAKLLGYDCRMIWGTLEFRGEEVTHSWNEIWEKDGPHIYDPRRNGGQDMGGFDKKYGEKDTYKYNLDNITYLDW